jgi:hypothetical protein
MKCNQKRPGSLWLSSSESRAGGMWNLIAVRGEEVICGYYKSTCIAGLILHLTRKMDFALPCQKYAHAQGLTLRSLAEKTQQGARPHAERAGSKQQNVKLLNMPPEVRNVLDMVGVASFYETYTDLKTAVESF